MSSNLPSDITRTTGLNWLMEQYPDEDYGEGVLNPDILPPKGSASSDDGAGPTSLPDGIVLSGENDLGIEFAGDAAASMEDLGTFLKDSALADLSWLDVEEQDLSRLPKDPHYDAVPELEEEWAKHRGEPGIHFHANVDPELARYRASLETAHVASENPQDHLTEIVRRAMRLSVANPHLPFAKVATLLQPVVASMPAEVQASLDSIQPAMKLIAAEHGLAGRVFIRAEAYPGYENGRWADEIRKYASGARYIVVPRRTLNAGHHHDGHCSITKKTVVASVPWERARRLYASVLQATGRTLSEEGDAREALLTAFQSTPASIAHVESPRPRHVMPSERVSADHAAKVLRNAKPKREHVSRKAREEGQALKAAQHQVARWVSQGLLQKAEAVRLLQAEQAPSELLRRASASIMRMPEAGTYSGLHNEGAAGAIPEVSEGHARGALAKARKTVARERAAEQARLTQIRESRVKSTTREAKALKATKERVKKVAKAIQRGVRGTALKHLIRTTLRPEDVHVASEYLNPILQETNALAESTPKAAAEFSGPEYQQHVPMQRKASLTPSQRELESFIKWARLKLTEGMAGQEFDALLRLRWANSIRTAGAKALQIVRDRHEGLAGHLYVDAAAYATPAGTRGCDEGGLHHRTTPVRFVLAMDRCGSCAFANQRKNGRSVCQKYNKDIITAADLPANATREFQRRMIREANMSDAEATASIFAPGFDANEFNLVNANMDDLAISEAPVKPLEGIWFDGDGGLELELGD